MTPRFLAAALAAVTACGLAAAPALAGSHRARLTGFVCQRAMDPPTRLVAVKAVMRPLPKTVKMALRFRLVSKKPAAASYAPQLGGDLGTWISPSDATLGRRAGDVWILNKQVADLAAPATYRFTVDFRWTGAHGKVLGTATRTSPTCFQPELRPDLLVQVITVQPVSAKPSLNRYVATIRNAGGSAAGTFQVLFAPGGSGSVATKTVQSLGVHAQIQIGFVGPACTPTTAPSVTADPNDQVDDLDRTNNILTATCPSAGAQTGAG